MADSVSDIDSKSSTISLHSDGIGHLVLKLVVVVNVMIGTIHK